MAPECSAFRPTRNIPLAGIDFGKSKPRGPGNNRRAVEFKRKSDRRDFFGKRLRGIAEDRDPGGSGLDCRHIRHCRPAGSPSSLAGRGDDQLFGWFNQTIPAARLSPEFSHVDAADGDRPLVVSSAACLAELKVVVIQPLAAAPLG
jgi:hypothetical protein